MNSEFSARRDTRCNDVGPLLKAGGVAVQPAPPAHGFFSRRKLGTACWDGDRDLPFGMWNSEMCPHHEAICNERAMRVRLVNSAMHVAFVRGGKFRNQAASLVA